MRAKWAFQCEALLISSGDKSRTRRRTRGSVCVEVRQPDSIPGQAIDLRGLDVRRSVAAKVAISHIICDDEHDVRALRIRHLPLAFCGCANRGALSNHRGVVVPMPPALR